MIFTETEISGVYIIEPIVYSDGRGYFMETYNEGEFKERGLNYTFVQDNQSSSRGGVIRGLHFQKQYPQAKLVRALCGEILDVAVDLRRSSKTFGKYVSAVLTEENHKMLLIPRGFAHGFAALSKRVLVAYKCDGLYRPGDEGGIIWNDKDIGVRWGMDGEPILSEKDKKFPTLREYIKENTS